MVIVIVCLFVIGCLDCLFVIVVVGCLVVCLFLGFLSQAGYVLAVGKVLLLLALL